MISRRRFLALAGASAGAMIANKARIAKAMEAVSTDGSDPIPFFEPTFFSYNEAYGNPPMLGRVTGNRLRIFNAPSPNAKSLRNVYLHYVGPIFAGVRGERYDSRSWSSVWYYLGPDENGEDEYIHSAFVAPTKEIFQPALTVDDWWWAEVTVPMAVQYKQPRRGPLWDWDFYKLYYGQVHRVIASAVDSEGNTWYQIEDDLEDDRVAWVISHALRRVDPSEIDPINPDVEDKLIQIDLGRQDLTAYEYGKPVFRTQIASGTSYTNPDGVEIDFSTPYGTYDVQGKRPSRRMRGGESFGLPYDVNGVPWVTYFSFTGGAIHGAFWHNNYGVPRSHGCINVTPDAAKWIYRWTKPYVPYEYVSRLIAEEDFGGIHTDISVV